MKNFFAIIIGVGGDLKETVEDANSIYNVLIDRNKGGYNPKNVYLLTDKNSTKNKVINCLEEIITKSKNVKNATVIFYYSGHGVRYLNEKENYNYYLKTFGSDKLDKEGTMLNGELLANKINDIKAPRLLVLLDCCHAAGMKKSRLRKKGDSVAKKNEILSNKTLLKKLNQGKGRLFISSCDDNEESVILPGEKNSLFTQVTLEVLNGYLNEFEEYISAIDLIYHVIKQVPKRVKKYNHIQRPIISQATNLSPDYFVCKNGNYHETQSKDYHKSEFYDRPKSNRKSNKIKKISDASIKELFKKSNIKKFSISNEDELSTNDDFSELKDFIDISHDEKKIFIKDPQSGAKIRLKKKYLKNTDNIIDTQLKKSNQSLSKSIYKIVDYNIKLKHIMNYKNKV